MNIRRAAPDDAEAAVVMRLAFLEEDSSGLSPEQRHMLEDRLPGYFQEHLDRDLLCYLAEERGEPAAMVLLLVRQLPPNLRFPTGRGGTVLNVYTRPRFRRQGLAEALVHLAVQDGRRLGLSILELQATQMGAPLYRKLGFLPQGGALLPMELPL